MRRVLIAMVIAILGASWPVSVQAQRHGSIPGQGDLPPGPHGRLKALDPVYNFGTALAGRMVNHVFKVKNVGDGNLIIRGIKTSCGCTAAQPTKSLLKPGEFAEISVGFDTRFQKGHQVRTITALTDDPRNPRTMFTLQGEVKRQVAASPEQVAFGKVRKGAERLKRVIISDLVKSKKFEVGPVSNSSPNIKVVQKPRSDGKPGAELEVRLLKTMPLGAFNDTIKVVTNRVPVNVSVFGTIVGDVTIDPPQVSFGIVPHGQDVVRILRLSNTGPRRVKVLGISSSDQSVTASAKAVKPGKEYKITVVLRRNTPEGQLHGQLAIRTDDPSQGTLKVPFYAIVGKFKI